jgi:hypothetical protein
MGNDKEGLNLQLAAVGWDHDRWEIEFYPDDLPVQWRLAYYSNEFRAVLVPPSYWQVQTISEMAQWYEDVPPRFRFYLQPSLTLSASPDWYRVVQSLGFLREKLAGFILDMPKRQAESQINQLRQCYPDVGIFYPLKISAMQEPIRCWCDERGHYAGWLDCMQKPSPKSLRLFIEQFVTRVGSGEGTLFIKGDITSLRDASTIAQLLGY